MDFWATRLSVGFPSSLSSFGHIWALPSNPSWMDELLHLRNPTNFDSLQIIAKPNVVSTHGFNFRGCTIHRSNRVLSTACRTNPRGAGRPRQVSAPLKAPPNDQRQAGAAGRAAAAIGKRQLSRGAQQTCGGEGGFWAWSTENQKGNQSQFGRGANTTI